MDADAGMGAGMGAETGAGMGTLDGGLFSRTASGRV